MTAPATGWIPIDALHWQVALNRPGEIVTDIDDINQCVVIILTTPKGSDPHRPEFGSNAWRYLDRPLPAVIPHIIRETVDAIRLWEPRVKVVSVKPEPIEAGRLKITVVWQPTDDAAKTFKAEITL